MRTETLRANRADLERSELRQRVLIDVAQARSLHHDRRAESRPLPLVLAPIGLCGMQHGDGEILSRARCERSRRIPFCLSTMSICSIEDVAEATDKPFWFPGLCDPRPRIHQEPDRAREGGRNARRWCFTVDLQILGQRHRDIKNGLTVPPEIRLKNLIDIATKRAGSGAS
jgi:L-lactate dehydrogenase (cytochrome)